MSERIARFPASVGSGGTGPPGPQGPPGTNGAIWYSSNEGPPLDTVGNNGDYDLDLTTGDIFAKSGGTWGTAIGNIMGPQGPAGIFPSISYHNPLGDDLPFFDVYLGPTMASFKCHIAAVTNGTDYNPPNTGEGVMLGLRVDGADVPINGSALGVLVYSDRGRPGNALEDNPPLLDLDDLPPANIYDHVRPGDIFDITVESIWPQNYIPLSMLRISCRQVSPSRANRPSLKEGFLAIPSAQIGSIGLVLHVHGTNPVPAFDHIHTWYAKLENSY